jgi:hypothetical protein
MGRSAEKRKRWFERGAEALSRASGQSGYGCPLCGRIFTNVAELKFEHAPPRSLGGREVALTCRDCNHGRLDAEMRRFEHLVDWSVGTSKRPLRARMAVRGANVSVNVQTVRQDGGAFEFVGLPDQNAPGKTAAHNAAVEAMVDGPVGGQGFDVSFPEYRYVSETVAAGWLRAAYVAAFARFGYQWAFQPSVEPVRAQIADPIETHIERFLVLGSQMPTDFRALVAVDRPRSLRGSVAVAMGRYLVFLPGFGPASSTVYERIAQRTYWPPRRRPMRYTGTLFSWPTSPFPRRQGLTNP